MKFLKLTTLKRLKNDSSFFIGSLILGNFLNFLFNVYLGRELSFEDYGLVTFITSLVYLVTVFLSAISTTVNHRIAFLNGQSGKKTGNKFYIAVYKKTLIFSIVASLLWLLATPLLMQFFKVAQSWPIIAFLPVLLFALLLAVSRGFLQGNLFFKAVGLTLILEALIKLILAFGFVQFNLHTLTYLTIPLSVFISLLFARLLISRKKMQFGGAKTPAFPRRFFAASIVAGLSSVGFLTIDILLVKHYLNPSIAGEYALLSLVGKMIFFFGSVFNGLIITLVSRQEGLQKDAAIIFNKILILTFVAVSALFLLVGPLGYLTIPIVFGAKAAAILPYLTVYGFSIALFTLSSSFLSYHLAKHNYTFPVTAIIMSGLITIGIIFFHQNIGQVVNVILVVSILNFAVTVFLHLIYKNGKFILANLLDFLDLFFGKNFQPAGKSQKRILVFNWRDTKHKFGGGAEVYIHELARRWVKEGHHVTLFCGNDSENKRYEVIDGVEIIRRGGFYFVYVWAFLYYLIRFRNKFDVIIDCQNGIPFFTPFYANEKIYCLMFHVHQEVFAKSLSKPMAIFAQILENRAMPWVYRNTRFITISESSKQEIQALDLGRAGIEIVYPGIDLKTYKKGAKKSKDPLILYVGRLKQYKSVDVFLKTAKTILKTIPKSKFVIAGDGEEKENLILQAKDLGIEEKISFLGRVSEAQKINLYQKAWVFVNPSFMEGWGITSIEANACGTPVIASNIPGLKDSVQNPHTGFLVDYGDHNQFARRIIHLIKNHKLRQSMSKKGIKWANNFDWNKSAQKGLLMITG